MYLFTIIYFEVLYKYITFALLIYHNNEYSIFYSQTDIIPT